jgi:hypothetical protein
MSLTQRQLASFSSEGWLDLGPVLSTEEIDTHRAAYDSCLAALAERHAGDDNLLPDISRPPRPGLQVHQIRAAHLQHEVFAELIRRPQITDAVASLVADDLKIILCQGLYKPPRIGGELNWHQVCAANPTASMLAVLPSDRPRTRCLCADRAVPWPRVALTDLCRAWCQDDAYFETESVGHKVAPLVSCWVTFDDATVDSSCMWVLPGGHASGVLEHATAQGLHLEGIDESIARPVELKAGHAMLHHGAMPHRTLPNTSPNPRRAVAIHYVPANATTRNSFRHGEPPENTPLVRSGSGAKL